MGEYTQLCVTERRCLFVFLEIGLSIKVITERVTTSQYTDPHNLDHQILKI